MMEFLDIGADELMGSMGPLADARIADCFGQNVTQAMRDKANGAIRMVMDHVASLYDKRRREPRDDLLTSLLEAHDDRGALSMPELITLFSTIFGSGSTTAATLDAAGTTLTSGGVAIPLPAAVAAALAPRRGRGVTLGVRPEDLRLDGAGPGVTLEGTVDVREPLGSEVLVHLDTPVGPLVARHPGQRVPEEGGRTKLHFTYEKLYVFDPDTELSLKGAD
mgnify:CR=1 FL=1